MRWVVSIFGLWSGVCAFASSLPQQKVEVSTSPAAPTQNLQPKITIIPADPAPDAEVKTLDVEHERHRRVWWPTSRDLERFVTRNGAGNGQGGSSFTTGNSGLNAFTGFLDIGAVEPTTPKSAIVNFYLDDKKAANGSHANAGGISLEFPMAENVSLTVQSLFEKWDVPGPLAQAQGLDDTSGTGAGDINLLLKWNFLEESDNGFATSLLIGVKTATGSEKNRRFTNSAGYLFGLTAGKTIYVGGEDDLVQGVRATGTLAFAAYDDSAHTQNDLGVYGLQLTCSLKDKWSVGAGVNGSIGWLGDDAPANLDGYVGRRFGENYICKIGGSHALNDDAADRVWIGFQWGK